MAKSMYLLSTSRGFLSFIFLVAPDIIFTKSRLITAIIC